MSSTILGISAFYHDSAACLLRDGLAVAAAQEERFSRKKHDASLPREAIAYCLREAGLESTNDLDAVVFYDKPIRKFDRLLESYLHYAPRGIRSFLSAMPSWLSSKLKMQALLRKELAFDGRLLFVEHHESHAASAFFPSPFQRAAILTVDGVGEWCTASIGRGEDRTITLEKELRFPHSLGLLYSAFTTFAGFEVNSGEYKLMGLAPYGSPRYVDRIFSELVDLADDGSLQLNMKYFDFCTHLQMTNKSFADLFDGPARAPEGEFTTRDLDLAASIQKVVEKVVLQMARHASEVTGLSNLVLAGGVALNCVANGRLLREGPFDRIWVQPAAGDAGGAMGAALFAHHQLLAGERKVDEVRDSQRGSLLGPGFDDATIASLIERRGIIAEKADDPQRLVDRVAELLAEQKVVGWFQGRMEFGPRALGNRSILADPRDPEMQKNLNLRIKFRESFRPFAPAVMTENLSKTFELETESPYMLMVAQLRPEHRLAVDETDLSGLARLAQVRSTLPAITHVDGSARVQSVDRERNPLFHELLASFHRLTGCPVLVNTSFNVRGEPIVCTPEDAYSCFEKTGMHALVLGPYIIEDKPGAESVEPRVDVKAEEEKQALLREARRFGLILAVLLSALAALSYFREHASEAAVTLLSAASAFAILATWAPAPWILFYGLWSRLAKAIAGHVSQGVLVAFFFLGVTPLAVLLRLAGRKGLDTTWREKRISYWQDRTPPEPSLRRYEKSF